MKTRYYVGAISALCLTAPTVFAVVNGDIDTGDEGEEIIHCWTNANGDYDGITTIHSVDPVKAARMTGVQEFNAVTLLDNGDPRAHVDLVFVGDGYREEELDEYRASVDSAIAQLFAVEPFKTYKNLFNIHRIDVISNESGIDNDPSFGIERDTTLGMGFWCNGIQRAVCSDSLVTRAIAESYFEADQIIAIGNSPNRGGAASRGQNIAHVTSRASSLGEVMIHELGHSLGRLADEYDTGGPADYPFIEPNEPNVSTMPASVMYKDQEKWHQWMGESFPEFDGMVSTFEGAQYSLFGIYRPSIRSRMRSSLSTEFNMPSVEQLVIQFYGKGEAIEHPTIFDSPEHFGHDVDVRILTNEPATHQLEVIWKVNNQLFVPTDPMSVDVCNLQFPPGRHLIAVSARDNTPWVRNQFEIEQRLTSYRHWWINIDTYPADANNDGAIDYFDFSYFLESFTNGDPATDLAEPQGIFDVQDIFAYVDRLTNPCGE